MTLTAPLRNTPCASVDSDGGTALLRVRRRWGEACHHYDSSECATACQYEVAEAACYRLEKTLMGRRASTPPTLLQGD